MNDVQGLTLARLRGEIRRVVFENEDTQFAVLKVEIGRAWCRERV